MTHQTTPDQTPTKTRAKVLDLSLTQLLGGSAAAATAAALGSRLGVVGTITGAAVLSLISAVAASLYTTSMTRARDAVVLVRSRRGELQEVPLSRVEAFEASPDAAPATARGARAPASRRGLDRAATRRVLVTTGALFAIAAAFLTGLQLATGAQVTGTSIGGRVAAASGAGASTDGHSSTLTRGATGTPTTGGAGASGGAAAPAGAGATQPATVSGTPPAPAATQTATATSGSPATGIPTVTPTASPTATSP